MPRKNLVRGRLFYLLILLISLIFLYPLLQGSVFRGTFLNMTFTFILIAIIYGLKKGRNVLLSALAIGVPWIALMWLNLFTNVPMVRAISVLFMTVLFGFAIHVLLRFILNAERVTANLLFGAGSIYLLLGFAWSGVYMFIAVVKPGSFMVSGPEGAASVGTSADLVYYSFTTLTTLGYGDIVPRFGIVRSIAVLEAITGVLFMSILIATLVGVYVSHSQRNGTEK